MQQWLVEHPLITYILIYVFLVYVYNNVFRVRKLPLLKDLIVYLVIGIGGGILWLFQLDLELPIVVSLGVAVLLMLMVRIRYWVTAREERKNPKPKQDVSSDTQPPQPETKQTPQVHIVEETNGTK